MKIRYYFFLLLVCGISCQRSQEKPPALGSILISQVTAQMTDIMVHDVTNPPLAARFFAYAYLAGYEIVSQNDSNCVTMARVLNGYPVIKKPVGLTQYSTELSAVLAIVATAKKCNHPAYCWNRMKESY